MQKPQSARNTSILVALIAITTLTLGNFPQDTFAQSSGFNPNELISDERFGNGNAFASSDAVQRFLEQRGSLLANSTSEFLKLLKEPVDPDLKTKLEDPRPNLGRIRTAAELIFDASQQGKLNPQVILVTLNKEQSLITGNFEGASLQRRLDRAMGFACPDSGSCGDLFLGFYYQLFGNIDNEGNRYLGATKSLAKSFTTPGGRGPMIDAEGRAYGSSPKIRTAGVGDVVTFANTTGPPNNASPTQVVTLSNLATAALYRYTPHVYNGNYNFWKFFAEWFRFTNGSLVKIEGEDTVYYIENSFRRPVSGTVLAQRGLDVTNAFTVSVGEISDFPISSPLPPRDGTILAPASGGKFFLVIENLMRPLSNFVAGTRGLNLSGATYLPDEEVASYAVGDAALPPEGTLLTGAGDPTVYQVEGGKLRPISGFVFGQRKFSFANVLSAPGSDVSSMSKGTPLPPLDGTLIKEAGQPLVYYTALGQKYPIPYYVFLARNFRFADIVTLGLDEVDNLTLAQHLAPADGTVIKARENPTVYLVEAGALHYITGFLFQHRHYSFVDVIEVTPEELSLLPTNSPLYLAEGSLIKIVGDGTVFVLEDGNKLPLTYEAFVSRGYNFGEVIEISTDEAPRYPTGILVSQ